MTFAKMMLQRLLLTVCLIVFSSARGIKKPTNSATIRQSADQICANREVGEFVENPDDCSLFYLCVDNGDAVVASCPKNMLFNPGNNLCDVATNVRCSKDINTRPRPNESNGEDLEVITDATTYCRTVHHNTDRIVYVGSSNSCSQYYICYYGQAIATECSSGLHWNAITGKCDLPESAQCSLHNNIDSSVSVGASTDLELIHCPAYGQHIFPHMERCEFFIYCVKGHAILQQCPFYYHFDVVSKSCQWQRTALCVRELNLNLKK